ncbi:uncharacterized protein LOC103579109 [Microplitis demolitor]|uniref:uncharacterized protein LOC103579109 n=1 Tax=Microplitis demolitor TaxID=69319 RepID=UPI0004CD1276|nr:uncharacterized protein LOC103579109 [Microplitis demolitor]
MSSKKKRVNYDNEQLKQALAEVKAGKPIKTTALKFNIPRTTLMYKSRGQLSSQIDKPGPECVLGQDNEKHLVDWIFYMKNHGFPITKVQLLNSVRMLLNTMKKKTIFPNNMPGRHWYNAFRRRHPEIEDKIAKNFTNSRAAVSEEKIRTWFKEVQDHLEPLDLLNIDATRKFNLNESAFKLNPKSNSVLASKDDKTVDDEKECVKTLICGNAAGQMPPPMILFPYKRVPRNIASSMPKDWAIGCSDSGSMTAETFYEYIVNVFHPWILKNKVELPVILYLDGHTSYLSYPLTKFCREKNIELIALYPNATHILQPMDVAIFRPLKAAWSTEVRDWRMEHNGEALKRQNFAPLLEKSLATLDINEILQNEFKSTGLHPFSADAITYTKFFESEPESTAEIVPAIIYDETTEHLRFIESHIEDELLEQFKAQEKSAQWNGKLEDTSLFLFWQKIKQMTSRDILTENTAPLTSSDVSNNITQEMETDC